MIVKFVLCALLLLSVSSELLPLNESSDSVARVIERMFGINDTVCIITDGIMIDVELFKIPNPKIIWNFDATQELGKQQTVSNFIIQVNDSNSLGNTLMHLRVSPVWNSENTPSGTFLIIISGIDKVFENLWMYNISNSVILVNGNGSSKCRLYQSTPWSVKNECGKRPNVTYEEDCQDGPTLIFKKGFRSYHGCPISFGKFFKSSFSNGTMTELTERYGVCFISGNDLQYYPLEILRDKWRATYAVKIEHYVWLMPLPKQVPPLKLYLIIFQEEVWIMVAVGFLITILFYVIISLCKRIRVNFSTFGFINMEILSITFWGSCSRIPDVTALRVLLLSYIFYCIVVQTGYTSNLIRVQTIPQFEPGITSIRELIKSNIPIYADHFFSVLNDENNHLIFQDTKKEIVVRRVGQIYIEMLSSIVHNNQAAAIMSPGATISLIRKHKTIHNKLILDDSVLKIKKYVFSLPNEHYFFDILNKVVTGLTENGFYAHLNGKTNELLKNAMQSIDYPSDPQVLKLDHIYGIFIIWGFCLGISFLVFILEIIVHKWQVSYKSNTIKPIAVTVQEEEEKEEEEEIIEIEYIA